MLDLFEGSSRPGDGGQDGPCSKEDLVPELVCPVGSLVGGVGRWLDSHLFMVLHGWHSPCPWQGVTYFLQVTSPIPHENHHLTDEK